MILNKEKKTVDSFLSLNNDIYRMIKEFDKDPMLKQLLINTDNNPLNGPEVTKSLIDAQISRVALLPYDDEEGSILNVTFINGFTKADTNTLHSTVAIDIFTPGNQWVINEGVRPLIIANVVDNIMRAKFQQTDGVKYRLTDILNAQLSDTLVGYRLVYISVIDD